MPIKAIVHLPADSFLRTGLSHKYEIRLPEAGDCLPFLVFGTAQRGLFYNEDGYLEVLPKPHVDIHEGDLVMRASSVKLLVENLPTGIEVKFVAAKAVEGVLS